MYVTPYFALIPELGKTANERLNLSTYISVTFFLGTAVASQAAMIWNKLEEMGIDKVMAIRYTFIGLAGISLLFLMFPIWFIDERKYSESKPSEIKMMEALKSAFSKKEFRVFAISDLSYFLALTILQTGLIYYITVLLELPESLYSTVFILLGVLSFLFYPFVNLTAKKIGKKKLMIIAFSFFTIMYLLVFTLGMDIWFIPNNIQIYILIALAAFPMAVFGILPNAILSDIAEHDAVTTGNKKEAIFYGVRTLMSKVGQMLSMFIFSSLLLFGKDVGDSLGIRLTGPVAAVFSFIGLIFFLMYDEKKMLSVNKKE
jgi:GPH family glycoside/pentoside/hexuronide:cation symporter